MVRFLLKWLVLSIPLGISLGKFIKAAKEPGRGMPQPQTAKRGDVVRRSDPA